MTKARAQKVHLFILSGVMLVMALLRRDFYTISLFVYLLFFLGLLVGYFFFSLPVTFLAIVALLTFCLSPYLYDGQKQTIKSFASLPVSRTTLVRSRYLYASIWIIGMTAVTIGLMQIAAIFQTDVYLIPWQAMLFYISLLFILLALSLPHLFLYRFQLSSSIVLFQMIILFQVFFYFAFDDLFEAAKIETVDGFIVEMTAQSIDQSFEVIASKWSMTANLLFFLGAITLFILSYALVVTIYKGKNLA